MLWSAVAESVWAWETTRISPTAIANGRPEIFIADILHYLCAFLLEVFSLSVVFAQVAVLFVFLRAFSDIAS
jgi:hypothetical protein